MLDGGLFTLLEAGAADAGHALNLFKIDLTDLSIIAIEDLGNLLKGWSFGLDVEEVDEDEFKSNPASVDGVKFPVGIQVLEAQRIDVLVDDQGDLDPEVHHHQTLGTDLEWHDLDGVRNQQARPCKGITNAEDPDESHDSSASALIASLLKNAGADGPANEDNQHTSGSQKEERTTSNSIAKHGEGTRNDQAENGETTVDAKLGVRVCDPNAVVDVGGVIAGKTVTRPLGEESKRGNEQEPVTVASCLEEVEVAAGFLVHEFEAKSLLDLSVLELDSRMVDVAIGVVFSENMESLVGPIL